MRLIVASASTARSFSASRRSICSCFPASSAAIAASPIRLVSNPTGPPTPSSQNDFQRATSGSSLLIPAPFLGAGAEIGLRSGLHIGHPLVLVLEVSPLFPKCIVQHPVPLRQLGLQLGDGGISVVHCFLRRYRAPVVTESATVNTLVLLNCAHGVLLVVFCLHVEPP